MFCPNCGGPLNPGAKFCPQCGTPVPEAPSTPAAPEVPKAPETPVAPEAPKAPETTATPEAPKAPEPPKAPETPKAPEPPKAPEATATPPASPIIPGVDANTMTLILRIVCGVLGAVFAFFALRGAFSTVSFLFSTVTGVFELFRFFGPIRTLIFIIINLLRYLLTLLVPAVAAVTLLVGAAKWEPKHNDFVVCGVAAAAVLRVIQLILVFVFNILLGIWVYHFPIDSTSAIAPSLLRILGYIAATGVVFAVMYLMGCPPVLGETVEEFKAKILASFNELTAGIQKAAADAQAAAAQKTGANAHTAPVAQAAPTATPTAYVPVRRMKTNRGLLVYILLSIVTCGIYGYFFIHGMAKDMNDVCSGDGKKTGGLLAFILLNLVTCGIYSLVWWYKLCNRQATNAPRYGLFFKETGANFLLWTLLGSLLCGIGPLVAIHFTLRNMNALCAAYNQRNGLYG